MNHESKTDERRRLRARRDLIPTSELDEISTLITDSLVDIEPIANANLVASYAATSSEVSMAKLHDRLAKNNIAVALPRVRGDRLEFIRLGEGVSVVRSTFGIDEPQGDPIALAEIDAIVVPGIAFDHHGYRMGYGGGFYDRLLDKLDAPSIGVCPDALFVETLTIEPHDRCVDYVVTETQRPAVTRR